MSKKNFLKNNQSFVNEKHTLDTCIICLERKKITITPTGYDRIIWAANLRTDIVYETIKGLESEDVFSYMTNELKVKLHRV